MTALLVTRGFATPPPPKRSMHQEKALTPLVIACLLITYVVWGTTYFAITVALRDMPPLFMMGSRFIAAGAVLYSVMLLRRAARPSLRQLRNCAILGALLLLGGMGGTALAEQSISSGATTVMIATMPIFALLWQIPQRLKPRSDELLAIGLGTAGVLTLASGAEFTANWHGSLALMVAIGSWSLGTQCSRSMDLPAGPTAFALEMLMGGVLLVLVSALVGETPHHWPSGLPLLAWLYLIVFGSLVAFSAYMYLASQVSGVLASSYVYVNPPIALGIGALLGGERIARQTVLAVLLILGALAVLGWGTARQRRLAAS